jgi:TM2 domain-containing membrane protein YozV
MKILDKTRLSEKQLLILQSEMQMRRKSVVVAYLIFLLPVGWLGAHHWYLRHLERSLFYILFWFGMGCCVVAGRAF